MVVSPYDAVILCPPDLVLLVRSGPVIRDLGGSVHIWGENAPVLISYLYDGAAPVKVFQNRHVRVPDYRYVRVDVASLACALNPPLISGL